VGKRFYGSIANPNVPHHATPNRLRPIADNPEKFEPVFAAEAP
jgi:hypothetical protein